MATLDTESRKKLKKSQFVFQKERRYPIHDRSHGANALSRVSQYGSADEKKKVRSAVCSRYSDLPACGGGKKTKGRVDPDNPLKVMD